MHQPKLLVAFDVNGTLFDDMLFWWAAISKVFEVYGVKPPTPEEYFCELEQNRGNFWQIYISRGIPAEKKEVQERMNSIYQKEYESHFNTIELSSKAPEVL